MRVGTARDAAGRRGPVVERDGALYALDRPLLDAELPAAAERAEPWPGARLEAPLRPGKVVAIGLNYADHVREAGMETPAAPLVFAKFPSAVIGPDAPIVIDAELTSRVDWEVELAVVIGRRLRRCDAAEAMAGVFGYTVGNDVSARDLQFGDGQWIRGKSLDTFCPLGPLIVTADEVPDPQALGLALRVNGETMQDSSTAEMIFGVADVLVHCARAFTLEPGDVVLTGTPWGCGEFMDPRRALAPGDVVEAEVEGIGVLRNPVAAAD
jgi:2-keto-4-pentenoate hydratase/2-oxohepta-3-ene-1,7-dioic acid hydratase in catechol pathway